ncbi:MAG TPA: FAD-binding and (Fe-S)-binding domain-containing protein [Bacteroidales bacterium]|nr:FAD-binding and (Fe-S)-binding domain-containing protein [Bacteroidales bacterium]
MNTNNNQSNLNGNRNNQNIFSGFQRRNSEFLTQLFNDRVRYDKREMKMYSHDIAAIPGLVSPFVGNTLPHAVVQPENEEEVLKLVKWAASEGIHLTPRAKSTSGYGGVIPVKRDVVVDFHRMKNILDVDEKNHLVTVQPGIVWEKLDHELKKEGLTVSSYPTSYPSSTVGGWFAQAGAGIGSYSTGWFRDNVVSARVVRADGKVQDMEGEELDLIYGAEGTTGFITQLTVKIMKNEEQELLSIGCPTQKGLQNLISLMDERKLPVWSMMFINPRMAELKNEAPLREHNGKPVEERVLLPASYILTLAFSKKFSNLIHAAIDEIVNSCDAEILSERIAQHEWDHRFKFMVVKRLGPSLVPTEIVVPLENLDPFLTEIGNKVDQPVIKEGVVIRKGRGNKPEVVILGFIPSDQRSFSYNFVFSLVLTIMKIAKKYGGRLYATGMYFSSEAKDILGKENYERMRKFKKETDPHKILNPGKVMKNGTLGALLKLAGVFEPVIRPFGNDVITEIGERPGKNKRGIPEDVAWYAYSCSQCGYCVDECDQFYGRGWESQSPRGKWYWLREYIEGREEWDQEAVDTFLVCTTCELCNVRCSAALPIEPSWMKLRGHLIEDEKQMTFPPFYMMSESLKDNGNIWAGYKKDRDNWFPDKLKDKHGSGNKSENVYFAGCTASYVENDIAHASVDLLDRAGVDFTYLGNKEECCGTPMLAAGKWDQFAEILKHNLSEVRKAGGKTVITSCPACDMMWRQVYPEWAKKLGLDYNIEVKHYSQIVAEQIKSGKLKFPESSGKEQTVTWHDSCHIGRVSHVYEEPREVIKAIPGVKFSELEHNHEQAHCCGSVLSLIKDPPVAADIGEVKLKEAKAAGAEKILSLCPCCELQFRVTAEKKGYDIKVVDLAHFTMEALGVKYPAPDAEVQKQWATFEAMIGLMTPEGFAKLMESMFPQLLDAMPANMGNMMRYMGKVPGMLYLMKPLFPVLMPRMMPQMMPKVMDTLLERIQKQVPMPDYMAEQMPQMMPKIMDNLMPHMIDDVVPLVTNPLILYLQGKRHEVNAD